MSINQLMTERPELLPALALAYIGDGVYELQVRKYLLNKGIYKVDDLHKRAIALVCANTQAHVAHVIAPELSTFEMGVLHRGRNAKNQHNPKGANITTYRIATGLEALVGYWYLAGEESRLAWFFQTLWQYAETNEIRLNQDFSLDEEDGGLFHKIDIEEEFRAELADVLKDQLAAVEKA